jgi:hypothetical protein
MKSGAFFEIGNRVAVDPGFCIRHLNLELAMEGESPLVWQKDP